MNTLLGIDVHGRITGLNCHDGILNMLDVRNKNSLRLGVRLVGGYERLISFEDITRLHVKNFREGNIIDSFSIWSLDSVPNVVAQLVLELSESDNLSDLFSASEKKKYLLLLESSYGASLCAAIETFFNTDEYVHKKISIE